MKKDSGGKNLYPNDEGIKVESTVQKIIDAFEGSDAPRDWRLLIGQVAYHTEDEINQYVANQIGTFGQTAFVPATEMAAALLQKRSAFAHESEIRLFVVDPSNDPSQSTVSISFDPKTLFNKIAFDPGLEAVLGASKRSNRSAMKAPLSRTHFIWVGCTKSSCLKSRSMRAGQVSSGIR